MLIDKISMDLLKALYKEDLPEPEVCKLIGWEDATQPDERVRLLLKEKLISTRIEGGVPDGAGGYEEGTAERIYHIRPEGRAVVEQERNNTVDKWLDRASNLIP